MYKFGDFCYFCALNPKWIYFFNNISCTKLEYKLKYAVQKWSIYLLLPYKNGANR